jgi:predicted MPP superfamily phosphohydrolase
LNSIFDLTLIAVFTAAQWRITVRLLRLAARRWSGALRIAAGAAIILLDILLAFGYAFSFSEVLRHFRINAHLAMFLGAATLAYLMAATIWVAIEVAWSALGHRLDGRLNTGRRRALQAAGNLLVAAPFAAIGYGALIERTDFRLRETDIPVPGLSADLDGLRILHLSDIHLSAFLSEQELARVIDACRQLNPHLVAVTGDLISTRGDPLEGCIRQLARLRSDAGTFACMGNHEYVARAEALAAELGARCGIRFLRGQNQELRFGGSTLNLAGVDYQTIGKRKLYLKGAERLVDPSACNVLLSHNPDVFPVAARQGYNLMLAGHTHGGQVTVEIFEQTLNPARFFTPYVYGLYRSGNASAYVTRGIGTIGLPARIGAPPEISLLRLRKA